MNTVNCSKPQFVVETCLLINRVVDSVPLSISTDYWEKARGTSFLVSGFDRAQNAMAYVAQHSCYATRHEILHVANVTEYNTWKHDLVDSDALSGNIVQELIRLVPITPIFPTGEAS